MDQFFDATQKKRIYDSFMLVAVLLAAFLASKTLNSIKENSYIGRGTYATNVISVTGTGEVFTVPDVGSFSFSVVEEGKTVKEAQDTASQKINSILNSLKSMGVAEKDIKTTGYNSYPKYDYSRAPVCTNGYCPPPKQVLIGYEVNQTVEVKVRQTDKAGDVLTQVGSLGATNISGLDFVVDDMDKVQDEARDKAVQDAKDKAKVLAKSLGVRLDKIVNFYESGQPTPVYYGMADKAAGSVMSVPVPPQIPTGENKITSNVTITYEVE